MGKSKDLALILPFFDLNPKKYFSVSKTLNCKFQQNIIIFKIA